MSFENIGEAFEMNEIPDSVVDEAARLIREEKVAPGAASAKAYKSHFLTEAPKDAISQICSILQERGQTAIKRRKAEENARIQREADAYRKAKDGEL